MVDKKKYQPTHRIKQPKRWKNIERHPLGTKGYRNITGKAWTRFLEGVRQHGIVEKRGVTLYEGKVLDGYQLYRACVELNIKPYFKPIPKNMTAEDYVQVKNDNRRGATEEEQDDNTEARRLRVLEARQAGESVRSIAEAEKVAPSTIQRDLDALEEKGEQTTPDTAKVKGADGKVRDAVVPKVRCGRCIRLYGKNNNESLKGCPMCAEERKAAKAKNPREPGVDTPTKREPKNGREVFDWKQYESIAGKFIRAIDDIANAYDAKKRPEYLGALRLAKETTGAVKLLRKAVTKL